MLNLSIKLEYKDHSILYEIAFKVLHMNSFVIVQVNCNSLESCGSMATWWSGVVKAIIHCKGVWRGGFWGFRKPPLTAKQFLK